MIAALGNRSNRSSTTLDSYGVDRVPLYEAGVKGYRITDPDVTVLR